MTKTEFISALNTRHPDLSKAQVTQIVDSIHAIVLEGLKTEGSALVPNVAKFKTVVKEATKERQGINPFTKQPITIAAKPASKKVKASVAKGLKDALE